MLLEASPRVHSGLVRADYTRTRNPSRTPVYPSPPHFDTVGVALAISRGLEDRRGGDSVKLDITAFGIGQRIPDGYAMFVPAAEGHVRSGKNRNPALTWSDLPSGTASLAVIVVDLDAPSAGDDVNKEGRTVREDLPRADFLHWVLVDIPASLPGIPEGGDSDGVTAKGKNTGPSRYGVRGKNDYTGWFAGDADMGGVYGGYDGPAPPWNDERIHHYRFQLFALDVPTLGLSGDFDARQALDAMNGHILAEAEHVGTYTLNPAKR